MTDRDGYSPDSLFSGARRNELVSDRSDKYPRSNSFLQQQIPSIERKILATKDNNNLLQRRISHNAIFDSRISPLNQPSPAISTVLQNTSLSKSNVSPAHYSTGQLAQVYNIPQINSSRGAKISPRRAIFDDQQYQTRSSKTHTSNLISAIQDQYYFQQTKESKSNKVFQPTIIQNQSSKTILSISKTASNEHLPINRNKSPLIVKLLADRAERSLDSKIKVIDQSNEDKNIYQQLKQTSDISGYQVITDTRRNGQEAVATNETNRSPPKVSSFRQKSTKFFSPSMAGGNAVNSGSRGGSPLGRNEEESSSNNIQEKQKQLATKQIFVKDKKNNNILKNVIIVPTSYLNPTNTIAQGSPIRLRKKVETQETYLLERPQNQDNSSQKNKNNQVDQNSPQNNVNNLSGNDNNPNQTGVSNNYINNNAAATKNPGQNTFLHSFKVPSNVSKAHRITNNLKLQQEQSSPEQEKNILDNFENVQIKKTMSNNVRDSGINGAAAKDVSTSLGRDSNKQTEIVYNQIKEEQSLRNSQSSKTLVIHRMPSDLRAGGSQGSAILIESKGSSLASQTKQFSFIRNSDVARGGSSDTSNTAKSSNMLALSSRSGIANHQNSSQSQSSTLIESTQNDKEKTRQFEEARFIAEMSKGDPTMDDFNLLQILGNGSYAVVHAAVHKKTHFQVAVKSYDKVKLQDPQKKQNVEREVKILSNLNHKNIIKLYKVIESADCVNLVMEYTPCLPMNKYIKSKPNKRLHEYEARIIFRQLVEAIYYLHRKMVLHRDIKLENILISQDRQVKLIDFGFSVVLPGIGQKINMFCGTPTYMAPEIVGKTGYTFPVDVWALGVLLCKSLTGNFPFQGSTDKALYQSIMRAKVELPIYISEPGKTLIESILRDDPSQRITLQEILKDEWLLWR